MKKIVCVAGAGPAGLHVATQLAKSGNEVHIFEVLSEKDLFSFCPWSDSIDLETLYLIGLPIPVKKGNRFYGERVKTKENRNNLYEPYKKSILPRITVDRNELIKEMVAYAKKANVIFHYNSKCITLLGKTQGELESLSIEGIIVKERGVNKTYAADIVIDATGHASVLRTQLSSCIGDQIRREDCLSAYKAIRRVSDPESVNSFKNGGLIEGKKGYRWISLLDEDIIDIGCCIASDVFTKDAAKQEVLKMIEQIPGILDEELGKGGSIIPLSFSPEAIVTNGFAVVGESAVMTNPGNGCGISGAVFGAELLANTIDSIEECNISSLWSYAYEWFSGRGAQYASYYVVNPSFTKAEVNYLREHKFTNGTLSNNTNFCFSEAAIGLLTKSFLEPKPEYKELHNRIQAMSDLSKQVFKAYINYPSNWNKEQFTTWCHDIKEVKNKIYQDL